MSFGEAIRSVFSKYATFSGRARRSEFWYFFLFNFLVSLGSIFLPIAISNSMLRAIISSLGSLYSLAVFIPQLAVIVRRLHDIGKSGWNYLILLIPVTLLSVLSFIVLFWTDFHSINQEYHVYKTLLIICSIAALILGIVFIVWLCRDSQPGANKWGPNPKEDQSNDSSRMNY